MATASIFILKEEDIPDIYTIRVGVYSEGSGEYKDITKEVYDNLISTEFQTKELGNELPLIEYNGLNIILDLRIYGVVNAYTLFFRSVLVKCIPTNYYVTGVSTVDKLIYEEMTRVKQRVNMSSTELIGSWANYLNRAYKSKRGLNF